jgi:G6PDH family F420-dependent oxidoreductase
LGPTAAEVAARIGDGFISTKPDADTLQAYRHAGGRGPATAGMKVCYDEDEAAARKLALQLWSSSGVPGELSQELPMPAHFEQASTKVTEDDIAEAITCGPDPDRHVAAIQKYLDAGFDEVYVSQVGPSQEPFFEFYEREVLPRL